MAAISSEDDKSRRIDDVFCAASFFFTRVEERINPRQTALAYFYAFFCDEYQRAVQEARLRLWADVTPPFPYAASSPERDWWHPPSPFLTRKIPHGVIRWILGEDLPGGTRPTGSDYRDFLDLRPYEDDWSKNLRVEVNDYFVGQFHSVLGLIARGEVRKHGRIRWGQLWDTNAFLEFVRTNTPPLAAHGQSTSFSHSLPNPDTSKKDLPDDSFIKVTIYTSDWKPDELADSYAAYVEKLSEDKEARLFENWPGGTPKPLNRIHIDEPETDLNWVVPSVSFNVYWPWASRSVVSAFAQDILDVFGGDLPHVPPEQKQQTGFAH